MMLVFAMAFLNVEEFELYSPRRKNASVLCATHYARLRRATAGVMKHIILTKSKSPSTESVKALGRWATIDSITPLGVYVTKANLLISVSYLLIPVSFLPYMC